MLGGPSDKPSENDEKEGKYGMSKAFFTKMFLPAVTSFQNDILEITIEQNRFIFYPYYFSDDSEDHTQCGKRRHQKAVQPASKMEKMLREKLQLIEQFVQMGQISEEMQQALSEK